MDTNEALKYTIALKLIPGVGDAMAKHLINLFGSPEAVFKEKKEALLQVKGIGERLVSSVESRTILRRAEEEIEFIEKRKIKTFYFKGADYPFRLTHCSDAPVLLYYQGEADLNVDRVVSIVGTRRASYYGKKCCEELVRDLARESGFGQGKDGVLIVSGLAYGIDICAHRTALREGLKTVAVLGHGLDRIYPAVHFAAAQEILASGGLLTEFMSKDPSDASNFPRRNRIVAGMSDATVVLESGFKGGSLITADIANSYSRDVFAFPGRVGDEGSAGCNRLIKNNQAALVESAFDVMRMLGWERKKTDVGAADKEADVGDLNFKNQCTLFEGLSEDEEKVMKLLHDKEDGLSYDELLLALGIGCSEVSLLLLNLELKEQIRVLPGKKYVVIS